MSISLKAPPFNGASPIVPQSHQQRLRVRWLKYRLPLSTRRAGLIAALAFGEVRE
jgi:hypothetical protein